MTPQKSPPPPRLAATVRRRRRLRSRRRPRSRRPPPKSPPPKSPPPAGVAGAAEVAGPSGAVVDAAPEPAGERPPEHAAGDEPRHEAAEVAAEVSGAPTSTAPSGPPDATSRDSGCSPSSSRTASAAQTGTSRGLAARRREHDVRRPTGRGADRRSRAAPLRQRSPLEPSLRATSSGSGPRRAPSRPARAARGVSRAVEAPGGEAYCSSASR